jgi:type II secretory pathway predicted ATPase ExeA
MNYTKYFGFTALPFHKTNPHVYINAQVEEFEDKFRRMLEIPGIAMMVGEPSSGKTTMLKHVMKKVKRSKVEYYYLAETDFSRNEFYLVLADHFGVEASNKRSIVWRNLKKHIEHMVQTQGITPVIIVDEAHNLPDNFFRDLPSFLNFKMESTDPLVMWLIGTPELSRKLQQPKYHALNSRIRIWQTISGFTQFEEFKKFIEDGFKQVGAKSKVLSESGMSTLFEASHGKPRYISNVIINAMQKAAQQEFTHIPDDILEAAIHECR